MPRILLLSACCWLVACSPSKQMARSARENLLQKEGLQQAHIGISIYDADQHRELYGYQAGKFFVPASNTKLVTCYAAMKYLGDSLPAIRYTETKDSIYLQPTGDPSFLHPDYAQQPLADFLRSSNKRLVISDGNWQEKEFGYGWSWDDYNSSYMAERSSFPVYGNVIKWTQVNEKNNDENGAAEVETFVYSEPEVSWKLRFNPEKGKRFSVVRDRYDNIFHVTEGPEILRTVEIPFVTNGLLSALDLLRDTLGQSPVYIPAVAARPAERTLYSRPLDSVLAPMMHRSDNLFAEQCLLMVSDKLLGKMQVEAVIDSLLKTDFAGMPQPPVWVDGSGLSRYNQFSPADFVWLLEKMSASFPKQRLEIILPAGNEGTLKGYYKEIGEGLHAKTGTLSGQVALSGFLRTKKGRNLIFSIMVNNHAEPASAVRRQVEAFLKGVYAAY